ncbi:DUF5134 domain-containing protein [Streptomyces sp. NPDC023723]|uniref:DUF5134 domain-containing protein n=1 Tax=Streptomyces sp. NPDC023723 TaxID=3154323 RepID=UPI0033F95121
MSTPVDLVHILLTVLFAVAAVHALWRGVRSRTAGRRDRVDHLLHGVMAAAMTAMPWSLGHALSGRTAVVLCAGSALWFPLSALHRGTPGPVAAIAVRLPSAAGMAAMAWMLRTPHGRTVPAPATAVTVLLTAYLLFCAVRSLTRPMPALRSATVTAHRAAATDPCGHSRDGAMALGTAVMLLMPH